ncbi:phosphopantothenate--cysteine ligase-like protein [Cricetulus griseus]|uniref:Phosphopantothenate--cysteine ligase-like protein n=1 Tax=Cricetulus griseus TaxID=10029 RepID=A0A061HYC6_CRIGR|nr:phosphopantothenate--cysteine ligase-like protein [Cricetulus griseus]
MWGGGGVVLSLELEENANLGFAGVFQRYQEGAAASTFVAIEFTTLADYLPLLHAVALKPLGCAAMFYLVAEASDFYIPVSETPKHKIHSSGGPLQITVQMVPKMLSPLVKN